jgi:hypothetical protein
VERLHLARLLLLLQVQQRLVVLVEPVQLRTLVDLLRRTIHQDLSMELTVWCIQQVL